MTSQAWTGSVEARPAMRRPGTVRAGIGAFAAGMLVSLISSAVAVMDFDGYVARQLAAGAATATPGVTFTDDWIRDHILLGLEFGLILVALRTVVLPFAWNGRNSARVVLWVLGGVELLLGVVWLAGFAGGYGRTGFTISMDLLQLLLTAAGVVLLTTKPSHEWYRYRRRLRADGQR